MLMIFSERKRFKERSEKQSKGENFWTETFPQKFRTQLLYAINESSRYPQVFIDSAQYTLCKKYGMTYLANPGFTRVLDFAEFINQGTDDDVADAIEVFHACLNNRSLQSQTNEFSNSSSFDSEVRRLLVENTIAFDLYEDQIIPRGEHEMYGVVIEPLLGYLGADPRFTRAKTAYLNGLDQIKKNDGPNAITDFGTAIEEMLRALGASGNNSGQLVESGVRLGLIKQSDKPLLGWIAAQRNNGEAHRVVDGDLDDAWLHAHVAGALLLKLSKD